MLSKQVDTQKNENEAFSGNQLKFRKYNIRRKSQENESGFQFANRFFKINCVGPREIIDSRLLRFNGRSHEKRRNPLEQ